MLKFEYGEIGYNISNEKGEVLFREVPPTIVFEYLLSKSSRSNFNYNFGHGTILIKDSIDKLNLYVFSKGRYTTIKYVTSYYGPLKECEIYIPDIVTLYNITYNNGEYSLNNATPIIVQKHKNQVYDVKKLIFDIQNMAFPTLPFTNIYNDGRICFGQVKINKSSSIVHFNSDFIYNYFFNSVFNSDLFDEMVSKHKDIYSYNISNDYSSYYESLSKLSKTDIDKYINFMSSYTRKIVLH